MIIINKKFYTYPLGYINLYFLILVMIIIIINFNDTRTAIIQSNKSEEIYNYINYKIKGGI